MAEHLFKLARLWYILKASLWSRDNNNFHTEVIIVYMHGNMSTVRSGQCTCIIILYWEHLQFTQPLPNVISNWRTFAVPFVATNFSTIMRGIATCVHENLILIGNTFEAVLLLFVLLEMIDVSVITVESLL